MFAPVEYREYVKGGKRKMLDFTCCVMFFNYWLTKAPGGATLTRPALHFPPLPVGEGWGEGISPHRTLH